MARSAGLWYLVCVVIALPLAAALLLTPPSEIPSPETVAYDGPKAPWYRRAPVGDAPIVPNGQGVIDLSLWPAEPESPSTIDPERFGEAMSQLCPRAYRRGGKLYAGWILRWSRHFGVDPMTVGALTYYRSLCRARFNDNGSVGLAAINLKLHAGYIKQRRYRYWVPHDSGWAERTLALPEHGFYFGSLRHAEPNIYFTAAILKVLEEQCPHIDGAFSSIRHRHPVSHFHWGDRVRGTDAEDRTLIARRRLINYYRGDKAPTTDWEGITLRSPLDGWPRKMSSPMGENRDGGRRRHKGVDFASERGEPVRAVADGEVIIAGPQLRGVGVRAMGNAQAQEVPSSNLGAGGLVVMVRHDERRLSAYMHLDGYAVVGRQKVRRGDLIGWVGRTGVRSSGAHLHFELRIDNLQVDPEPILGALAISALKTFRGLRMRAEEQRRRQQRRRARRGKR